MLSAAPKTVILANVNSDRTRHIQVPPTRPVDGRTPVGEDDAARTVRVESAPADEAVANGVFPPGSDLYSLYAIQARIGDGGMGVVYLARDRRLDRFVAIKRLNRASQNNEALRKRFLQEARAVAALSHIHIVHIYALGEDTEGPYIVMEYVAGPVAVSGSRELSQEGQPNAPLSLERQVSQEGQYTVSEAVELLVKITKAMAYAHSNGVIHRDLKPTNILLDETGEPKIIDFGLARMLSEGEGKLTEPGEKLLSLGYGAPEQEHDASVTDHRADIYGLGGLLYFAITGQNPRFFREQDIPVALREVLGKALATDREQRWNSAGELLEALHAVQSRTRVEQPTSKTTWRCKWCDTVNPLTIRFCAECGWDGGEDCPECGTDHVVGIQYCGKCGADTRAYESVSLLAGRMQKALDAAEYERVISLSSRAQGLEPAGPSGRELLKSIQRLREEAHKRMARRDQLKALIPMELRAENYERARAFVKEFRELSGNQQLYEDVIHSLPDLMVKRDLRHARRACREGEWKYALQLCDNLLAREAPDNPECLALRRSIIRRHGLRKVVRHTALAALLVLAYLLALPPLVRVFAPSLPRFLAVVMRPARLVYASPEDGGMLAAYTRWLGVSDLDAAFTAPGTPATAAIDAQPGNPAEMVALSENYARQLDEIAMEKRRYEESWPRQYIKDLEDLAELRRSAGDYESWYAVSNERQQFDTSRAVGMNVANENPELGALKQKYRSQTEGLRVESARRVVAATKKYINELTALQSRYTKDAMMPEAAAVNNEIRRIRVAPDYLAAESLTAESASLADTAIPVTLPLGEQVGELQPLRKRYDDELTAIEAEYTRNQGSWPEKYLEALNSLMHQFQNAGDFSGWEAGRNEIDRFEIDRRLDPIHLVAEPERLLDVQRAHLDILKGYRLKRARDITALAERQLQALQNLQSKYTKAADMETAGAVNAEIRRARNAAVLVAALAELAEAAGPPSVSTAVSNLPPANVTAAP